jgi:sRNA-binding carbon storage regulator CsrA
LLTLKESYVQIKINAQKNTNNKRLNVYFKIVKDKVNRVTQKRPHKDIERELQKDLNNNR